MEPEEIKAEAAKLKQKFEKRHKWDKLKVSPKVSLKTHRNCGGIVVYREPYSPTYYSYAGYCLKCEQFPIPEEDIVFESVVKPEFHEIRKDFK